MYKVTIGNDEYQVFLVEEDGFYHQKSVSGIKKPFFLQGTVNEKTIQWNVSEFGKGSYHVIDGTRSFNAVIVNVDKNQKKVIIRIGNNQYSVEVQDRFDMLIRQLGISGKERNTIKELKSPMPGLILDIYTEVGQRAKKNERLLVLEAMKMENVIKSPADGTVKAILVAKGNKVEKNQVLLRLE